MATEVGLIPLLRAHSYKFRGYKTAKEYKFFIYDSMGIAINIHTEYKGNSTNSASPSLPTIAW